MTAEPVLFASPSSPVADAGIPIIDVVTLDARAPIAPAAAVDVLRALPYEEQRTAVATPIGIWVERGGVDAPLELAFIDATGTIRARWQVPVAATERGALWPRNALDPIYDATGAWVAVDGRLVRLDLLT